MVYGVLFTENCNWLKLKKIAPKASLAHISLKENMIFRGIPACR